ncbi:restriction endonuclease subunit S [Rathayibacter sp. AY1B5]|uniref:restriction endonuclease subunit S n=1 Tax=Rathayibacter sp. AY1B5 TaxID=2080530 RepID=UPI000CE8CDB6|nr:restriction endonuclease subunit S [Rathayibacter sp. AY1B5]PPI22845.1 restriction endonuclease subunit S [Rathayibacter sp. AY1B5]
MSEILLKDGLSTLIDHRGKTPAKLGAEFVEAGVPVLSAILVTDGKIEWEKARFVTQAVFERWMPKEIKKGDVLLTSEAPLGRVARVDRDGPVVLGQRLFALRSDPTRLDQAFLYYALLSETVQQRILNHGTGSTVVGIRQPALLSVSIPTPALPIQRGIAEVLGALDDKIAALQRVNSASEKLIARELGSLHTVGSIQPQTVGEVVRFRNHERRPLSSAERNERMGTVPYYGAASAIDTVDEAIFDDRLVLVGEDGSVVDERTGAPVLQYISGPAWVNNHAHVLEGSTISTELLFHVLGAADVRSFVTGAVQPKLSMTNLKKVPVNIPSGDDLLRIEDEVQGLTAMQRANATQIKLLQNLRDTLLPALMSGKLRVKDAERAVEDVL